MYIQFSFIYGVYLTGIYAYMYTYKWIFTCIYAYLYMCLHIYKWTKLELVFSVSQVNTPEHSATLVCLHLSVSVSPPGAVLLCINNVILFVSRERLFLSYEGYGPYLGCEKKEHLNSGKL